MFVSVIIPTYNRKYFLVRAIQSVLEQTHQQFEVLVCDDGSTDGTEEVVKNIADERVVWLSGERGGHPSGPRNRGVAHAKGEWIAFLDSDDQWFPNKLEEQLSAANNNGVGFVCCNAQIIRSEEETEVYFKHRNDSLLSFDDLLADNTVITSSVLVKKVLACKVGRFPVSKNIIVGEDYILWLLISMNNEVYYLNKPLCIYRDEPELSLRGDDKRNEFEKYSIVVKFCALYVLKNSFSDNASKLWVIFRHWYKRYKRWQSIKEA